MFIKLAQILQESNSEFSSMRSVMVIWCLGILFMWLYVCFKTTTLVELPESLIAVIAVLVTGKYLQKKVENKPNLLDCTTDKNNTDIK